MTEPRWLVAIIILALLLRLGAAIYLGDTLAGEQQRRIQDQVSYNALAHSLLSGHGYAFDKPWYPFRDPPYTPTAHWSFIYPLYLAGVYAITGYHPLAARLVQAVLSGILSTWLVYQLGKRLFGVTVGLAAAALSAMYAYFIFHDAALMTEPFFIVGVLAMLNLALSIVDGVESGEGAASQRNRWLALGIVLGFTTLIRQTILLWLPFLLLWLWWSTRAQVRWWEFLIPVGITALFVLPWTVRNFVLYDTLLPLNSNAGYALYSANHPDHGTQFDQDYAAPLPEDLVNQGLNEAQWNTALTLRGLEFILQDIHRYLLLSLDRVTIFFNFWFSAESSLSSNLMRVFSYGLYLPFMLYGLALSRRDWRRCSLIYLFVLVYSSMHILTWASIRYRLPVDAALMPFTALAVVNLVSKFTTKTPRHQIDLHPKGPLL